MVETFHQLFVDHDVDLVISGHNHDAEIYPVDGVVYTVIGTASNELTPRQHAAESGSAFFDLAHQAFLDVKINDNNCSLSIQRYENGIPMAPVLYSFLQ
jgi:predicted phosphodiesterase